MADLLYDESAGLSPEDVAAKRRRADQLFGMVSQYPGGGGLGALAQALAGFESGRVGREASTGEAAGRKMSTDALTRALTGGNPTAAIASGLGTPYGPHMLAPIAGHVLQSRIQEQSPSAILERQQRQFSLDTAKQKAPYELEGLKTDIEVKKRKDAMDRLIEGLIGPEPSAAPSASAPGLPSGAPQIPPVGTPGIPGTTVAPASPMQKIGTESGEMMPGGVTPAQLAQPSAAPSVSQQPPAADLIDTPLGKMSRDRARRLGGALTLKGNHQAGKLLLDAAGPNEGHMATATAHDLDKAEIGFTNMKAAYAEIDRLYDPKYLQGQPKVQFAINNFRDKWTPDTWAKLKLTDAEKLELGKYEKFGASSMNNLNTRLKELSGTAVTATEMERILRELPSPGTGPFSGDGPTAFKSKLDQGRRLTDMAIARTRYLRANGFKGDVNAASQMMPLENMAGFIQQRGDAIQKTLEQSNPGADPNAIKQGVKQQLAKEFGMDI